MSNSRLNTLTLVALGLWLASSTVNAQSYYFREEFDDPSIGGWTQFSRGGRILQHDGMVTVSAPISNQFPFAVLDVNPFPANIPFSIIIGMQFHTLAGSGTGLVADVGIPAFDLDTLHPTVDAPFQWWGDRNGFVYYDGPPFRSVFPADLDSHEVRFDYEAGMYIAKLDGTVFDTFSGVVPSALWFGNPKSYVAGRVDQWTSFSIDYIRIQAIPEPGPVALLVGLLGTGLAVLRRRK